MSESFKDILTNLRKPIPKQSIKQRPGYTDRQGNQHNFDYIEWHEVANILDDKSPGWSHSIKSVVEFGEIVAVTVAITINGISREGIGTGLANSEMGIKRSEHDALKRAAVKFGVGRELYKKESDLIEKQGSRSSGNDFDVNNPPAYPISRSPSDLITAKQLGMIRGLARELGIDADEECQAQLGCQVDELSKAGASWMIGFLKEQKDGMEQANKMPRSSPPATSKPGTSARLENSNAPLKSSGGGDLTAQEKGTMLFRNGWVSRENGGYKVNEWKNNKKLTFDVTRKNSITLCSCGDYLDNSANNPNYRCCHILAVKAFAGANPTTKAKA